MCLQCSAFGFVYGSFVDAYRCQSCDIYVSGTFIDHILMSLEVKIKEPNFIESFNRVNCLSCNSVGGIRFSLNTYSDRVLCDKCDMSVPVTTLFDAKAMAQKTKLIEAAYGGRYVTFGDQHDVTWMDYRTIRKK